MSKYELVAVKRKWVPEWMFVLFSWPFDLAVYQPFRWILTKPVTPPESTSQIQACEVKK